MADNPNPTSVRLDKQIRQRLARLAPFIADDPALESDGQQSSVIRLALDGGVEILERRYGLAGLQRPELRNVVHRFLHLCGWKRAAPGSPECPTEHTGEGALAVDWVLLDAVSTGRSVPSPLAVVVAPDLRGVFHDPSHVLVFDDAPRHDRSGLGMSACTFVGRQSTFCICTCVRCSRLQLQPVSAVIRVDRAWCLKCNKREQRTEAVDRRRIGSLWARALSGEPSIVQPRDRIARALVNDCGFRDADEESIRGWRAFRSRDPDMPGHVWLTRPPTSVLVATRMVAAVGAQSVRPTHIANFAPLAGYPMWSGDDLTLLIDALRQRHEQRDV